MNALPSLSKQLRLTLFVSLVYLLTWLVHFGQTTLGQVPTSEEVTLLTQATEGPIISLYGALLACIGNITETQESLLLIARLINGAAILLAATLCATTAGRLWKSSRATWVAAVFIGMNPVIAFSAGQISPASLAILCGAILAWKLLPWLRHAHTRNTLIIALSLAIGSLFENAFLPLALIWPLAAFLYPRHRKGLHLVFAILPIAGVVALLMVSKIQLHEALHLNLENTAGKAYQFFSSQEVDHGLSYALQKQLHSHLLFNPIHWGLLLVLAGGGLFARIKDGHKGYSVYATLIALAAFFITYSLTDGDSSNRLAVAPLLAIFAAGSIAAIPRIWGHAGPTTRRKLILGCTCLAALSYTGYWIHSPSIETRNRDYTFMAEAHISLNDTEPAMVWAEKTLGIERERKDMRNILVRGEFNRWALASKLKPLSLETVQDRLEELEEGLPRDPISASIKGIYLWQLNQPDAARELWQQHANDSALAQMGLLWTSEEPYEIEITSTLSKDPYVHLLEIATTVDKNELVYSEEEKLIDSILSKAH